MRLTKKQKQILKEHALRTIEDPDYDDEEYVTIRVKAKNITNLHIDNAQNMSQVKCLGGQTVTIKKPTEPCKATLEFVYLEYESISDDMLKLYQMIFK